MNTSPDIQCYQCGISRSLSDLTDAGVIPCPNCGSRKLASNTTANASGSAIAVAHGSMARKAQPRDWSHRWSEVQREYQLISIYHSSDTPLSQELLESGATSLLHFFVHTFSIRDALAQAFPTRQAEIFSKFTSGKLGLLADLANTEKHVTLSRQPKSGQRPLASRYLDDFDSEGNWRADVEIQHGASMLLGQSVAKEIMDSLETLVAEFQKNAPAP